MNWRTEAEADKALAAASAASSDCHDSAAAEASVSPPDACCPAEIVAAVSCGGGRLASRYVLHKGQANEKQATGVRISAAADR